MKKHVFLIIMLTFAWLSTNSIFAQDTLQKETPKKGTVGIVTGVQWKGFSGSSAIADVYVKGTYYMNSDRHGGSVWVFANFEGSSQIMGYGYFAIGASNRSLFKKRTDSFLEFGGGVGLQTGLFMTIRPMAYVHSIIPIKKRRLEFFAAGDFGLTFLPGQKIAYRYKLFGLYQLSAAGKDEVNIHAGLLAEYDAGIGPMIQVTMPGDNIRLWFSCGANLEREDWHTGRKPSFGISYGLIGAF